MLGVHFREERAQGNRFDLLRKYREGLSAIKSDAKCEEQIVAFKVRTQPDPKAVAVDEAEQNAPRKRDGLVRSRWRWCAPGA